MEHLTLGEIGEALDGARRPEVTAIRSALDDFRFIGLTGAAESGKTKLLQAATAPRELDDETAIIRVDLDGVYSPRDLTRRWLRAIARAIAGPIAFSHMVAVQRDYWPSATRRADRDAREVLREDYEAALADRAPRMHDKGGDEDIARALAATSTLSRIRRTSLIMDHLEAPELSGAFDVRAALWKLRAVSQHEPDLSVVLVCRPRAVELAADQAGAFFGDGTWLTIEPPSLDTWMQATGSWKRVERIYELTAGHVWATAMMIERMSSDEALSADRAFATLAFEQEPLAARCVQHAASLHRLGPTLLRGIANKLGPYQSIPDAQSRDVAETGKRLELGGLAHREQRADWRIVNPLVAKALRDPALTTSEQAVVSS